jgi:aryl-alcohol dehydrogenase-like predicted oxidoreductase
MGMDRRTFLTATAVGASGLVLAGRSVTAQTKEKAAPANPFEIVPLGKTGLKVSRIGLGTGMRGGNRESNQTRLGKEQFEALLQTAYDRGVRLFDMADMYGTHAYVGRALKKYPRESYVLVSKMWVMRGGIPEPERPDADVVIDRFRKEIGVDYIDLVLLHCMMRAKWTDEQKKYMDTMANLKAKGVIKAHGVSCHSLDALKAAAASPWVDSIHTRINAYGDAMDDKPEKVAPVLKEAHDAGKGVVGMKLVGEGRYRNSDEHRNKSVQYVLGLGSVDTMIVGFESVQELDDFSKRVQVAMELTRSKTTANA